MLDFNMPPPEIDWSDDAAIEGALSLPLQCSSAADRTTRSTGRPFEECRIEGRLAMAKAYRAAIEELHTEEVLSVEAKGRLESAAQQMPMVRTLFYEAHNDWDAAVMQFRFIMDPVHGNGT